MPVPKVPINDVNVLQLQFVLAMGCSMGLVHVSELQLVNHTGNESMSVVRTSQSSSTLQNPDQEEKYRHGELHNDDPTHSSHHCYRP